MIRTRKQNTTGRPITFLLVSATDHITPQTGKSPTVTLSKDGGAFGAAAGAVSEIGNGIYALAGHATDRNTLGELVIRATAAACDDVLMCCVILPLDPFDANFGLSNLDATVSSRLATSGYTAPTNPTDYARNNAAPSWYTAPANPSDYARNNAAPSWYVSPANPSDYARNNVAPTWYAAPPSDYARNNASPSWYVAPANPTDYARNNAAPTWYASPSTPPTVEEIAAEVLGDGPKSLAALIELATDAEITNGGTLITITIGENTYTYVRTPSDSIPPASKVTPSP